MQPAWVRLISWLNLIGSSGWAHRLNIRVAARTTCD